MNKFKEAQEVYIKRLNQYVPVVDKVHGPNHPEFHEVRRIYEAINNQIQSKDYSDLDLNNEFEELRKVTSMYEIPSDTCETYEAVYTMLSELDKDYVENFETK